MTSVEKLITDGFMLHKIHVALQEQLSATLDSAHIFFNETHDKKILNMLSDDVGYRPYGIEYSNSPSSMDQVESFSVNTRSTELISELPSPTAKVLCERMLATYTALEAIAEATLNRLANELSGQVSSERFQGAFHRWSLFQLNYSRPAQVISPFINETHEDGALLTIAYANSLGLELQMSDGNFVPITNAHDDVLILPGEIAWLLSGGKIRPLYHRVRPETNCHERMSLLFFGDIEPSLCEPWILNEVNKNIDIGARVLTNPTRFGLKGWTLE